jgi:hypothetical protein
MPPPNFNENNTWKQNPGTTLLRAAGGSDLETGVTGILYALTDRLVEGQHAVAGAIFGESTDDPAGIFGNGDPTLEIRGVHLNSDGSFTNTIGDWSNQTTRTFDLSGNSNVTLVSTEPAEHFAPYPPYPYGPSLPMTHVHVSLGYPGGAFWANGTPRWIGEWYYELYFVPPLAPGPGTGILPTPEVPCPARPPWPYKDPIITAYGFKGAQIRRSRP